jgi:hypothetical protein
MAKNIINDDEKKDFINLITIYIWINVLEIIEKIYIKIYLGLNLIKISLKIYF